MSTQAGLAGLASSYAGYGLRLSYLAEHSARLAATTLAEVSTAAARYLAPARGVTVVLGDAQRVEAPLRALTEVDRSASE
jgi:predicted Zn-dependent peptidase